MLTLLATGLLGLVKLFFPITSDLRVELITIFLGFSLEPVFITYNICIVIMFFSENQMSVGQGKIKI